MDEYCRSSLTKYGRYSKRPTSNLKVLFQKEMQYLRHTAFLKAVAMDQEKMKAIWQSPMLKDKHKLRGYLCLHTYY
jgi:hypothetical protein